MYAYVGNDPINGIDPTGLRRDCPPPADLCTTYPSPNGPYFPGTGNHFYFQWYNPGSARINLSETIPFYPLTTLSAALEPQNDPPCSMPADVAQAYRGDREIAMDLFNSIGGNKEVAYTIFRNDRYGNLQTYF